MNKEPKAFFLSLDLRSLALFRWALGIILIGDLITRFFIAQAFYTDQGVLPRSVLFSQFNNPQYFSILHFGGQSYYIYLLLLLAGLFNLAFLFGYRTRLFTFLSWIFFVSFTARNPVIGHGGDDLIRLALFWMFFLPSNAHFSIDRALSKTSEQIPKTIFNISSLTLMLQLVFVYIFTSLLKWNPRWTTEGSALFYALQLDQFTTWMGSLLGQAPQAILKIMTWSTMIVEMIVPLLVFIPLRNWIFRSIAVFVMISFHFGIYLSFNLGSFPWICIAYWLIFIPSNFWEKILSILEQKQKSTVIFYDGDCGYCLKMVNLIRTFLILPYIRVRKAQESEITFKLMKERNSWLVQSNESEYESGYRAFVTLIAVSPFSKFKKLFSIAWIVSSGERVYQWQASRRSLMGRIMAQLHPSDPTVRTWIPTQLLVGCLLAFVLYWNIAVSKPNDSISLSPTLQKVGSALRLHQQWNMFAPYPWVEDGWIVVEGNLLNGKTWDIFYDQPVSFDKPARVDKKFDGVFWLKYLINIWHKDYSGHRIHFGRYLCRLWNNKTNGENQVDTFKIYYMLEVSHGPDEPENPVRKVEIWDHYCFEKRK